MIDILQDATVEADTTATPKNIRGRKTTQNDPSYGSFFLRVGAIGKNLDIYFIKWGNLRKHFIFVYSFWFGHHDFRWIGNRVVFRNSLQFTMPSNFAWNQSTAADDLYIYANVLHFYECKSKNTTFKQTFRIANGTFLYLQLNIHRFKVIARFGLMHIFATNICVWIRTLIIESLKEITLFYQHKVPSHDDGVILDSLRHHTVRHAGQVLGTHIGPIPDWEPLNLNVRENFESAPSDTVLGRIAQSTVRTIGKVYTTVAPYFAQSTQSAITSTRAARAAITESTTTTTPYTTTLETTTLIRKLKKFISTTTTAATTTLGTTTTTTTTFPPSTPRSYWETTAGADVATAPGSTIDTLLKSVTGSGTPSVATTTQDSMFNNIFAGMETAFQTFSGISHNDTQGESIENFDSITPAAYYGHRHVNANLSCGRVSIMGPIVQDSAPYLYPFIIEYSLIGAVVIYVMWRHIGRYPKTLDEDLEHRLEIMLSRRAVVMAQQARTGRVDCVGASKGLFFGLLLLVGSLICLILFFILIRHPQFSLLAVYLADCSHCAILGLSILAILVGFCRFVWEQKLISPEQGQKCNNTFFIFIYFFQSSNPEIPLRGAKQFK